MGVEISCGWCENDVQMTRERDFGWDFTGRWCIYLHTVWKRARLKHRATALHKAYWLPCWWLYYSLSCCLLATLIFEFYSHLPWVPQIYIVSLLLLIDSPYSLLVLHLPTSWWQTCQANPFPTFQAAMEADRIRVSCYLPILSFHQTRRRVLRYRSKDTTLQNRIISFNRLVIKSY